MKKFSSERRVLKVELLKDLIIYCLKACGCIFQPGNLTGWGSERVKAFVLLLVSMC